MCVLGGTFVVSALGELVSKIHVLGSIRRALLHLVGDLYVFSETKRCMGRESHLYIVFEVGAKIDPSPRFECSAKPASTSWLQ